MGDYIRRVLIAAIMLLFISLLFLGGRHSQAQSNSIPERTKEWTWPSDGVITDIFNTRNGNHKGIDIAGELGTDIFVVDDGIVVRSYYSQSYGHAIFVKHANGLETVYAHLNERFVQENDKVLKGELIGKMGNTGHSSGVHLHFEIHEKEWTIHKENAIDPITVFGEMEVGQTVEVLKQVEDSAPTKELDISSSKEITRSETELVEDIQYLVINDEEMNRTQLHSAGATTVPYKKTNYLQDISIRLEAIFEEKWLLQEPAIHTEENEQKRMPSF